MGIRCSAAYGKIRFPLSRCSAEGEVDRVIRAEPPIIAQLRMLSPYWSGEAPLANAEQAFPPEYAQKPGSTGHFREIEAQSAPRAPENTAAIASHGRI